MLANHNVHVVAYLRCALRLRLSLVDPRLRWALDLPYLLLLSVLDLGQVLW